MPPTAHLLSPSLPLSLSHVELPLFQVERSEQEWREMLSPEQYNILRNKGTEYPGTGEYNKLYPKDGHFACAGCGQPLYSAASKFDSGCGWPAFDKIVTGAVVTDTDRTLGMTRVEIMCSGCGGHLGHVFEGEGFTPTNERHCVNSGSVKYVAQPLPAEAIEDKVLPGPGGADSKSDLMQGLSALFNKKSE